MKKYYLVIFVCVLLLSGICWIKSQHNINDLSEKSNSDSLSFNDTREKPIENLIISEEENTDIVYYLRDEKVDEIAGFSDFLDGQVSAYDNK